ncbi:20641_t:CDS:2 [Dentiscutata erythropus]|uniref:20641_t:CDS:1 n=1 Tax=Dentiscutata erythropus TaxID=1348616 RepID=A0A9N8VCM8_9GLOM|nr:20641_t:CDS:2 [Dentiscutata erythropus]
MFNYASYLEFYSNNQIDSWVYFWYSGTHDKYLNISLQKFKIQSIQSAIKMMLLRSCKNIKHLDIFESEIYSNSLPYPFTKKISSSGIDNTNNIENTNIENTNNIVNTNTNNTNNTNNINNIDIYKIYNINNISLSLNLSKLDFLFFSSKDIETTNKFVIKLSNQCRKILYMNLLISGKIFPPELHDSLTKLIDSQIKLEEFGLRFRYRNHLTRPHIINLESHANTLKKLQLIDIDFTGFSFNNLKVLRNLEVLSIHYCLGFFEEEKSYRSSENIFPKLQKLELIKNHKAIDQKFIYIKLDSLKTLIYINNHENEFIKRVVTIISHNCTNLITLCCLIVEIEITSEISKLQHLQQLQLGGETYFPEDLLILVENLPKSLIILNLLNIYSYDHLKFNNFIKKCNVHLEVLILPFEIKLNLLIELKNYIKKFKCLKDIKITRIYESGIDDKEMLDLFNEEGIKYTTRNLRKPLQSPSFPL